MQTPYVTYREAMAELSAIARSDEPAYVRVRAACAIMHELSPGNPAQHANHAALGLEPHPDPQSHTEPDHPLDLEVEEIMAELNARAAGIPSGDEEDDDEEDEPQ